MWGLKYRNFAHYLVGILTAMSSLVNWVLPVIGCIGFMVYELNEDWHRKDEAYYDVLEFLVGFFIAVTGLIIWEVIF